MSDFQKVNLRIDLVTLHRLTAIAKTAGTDVNTVFCVLLAAETMRPREIYTLTPPLKTPVKKAKKK